MTSALGKKEAGHRALRCEPQVQAPPPPPPPPLGRRWQVRSAPSPYHEHPAPLRVVQRGLHHEQLHRLRGVPGQEPDQGLSEGAAGLETQGANTGSGRSEACLRGVGRVIMWVY